MHASISDIIADVSANAIEAHAGLVRVSLTETDDMITLLVEDNGKGMDQATLSRVFDPFCTEPGKHDSRRIGMGLPFVKQTCDACGGGVEITSEKGKGTTLRCVFRKGSIDLPPMGDTVSAVISLFNFNGEFELEFTHSKGSRSYTIARSELSEAVGGFDNVEGLSLAREYLAAQEESLFSAD